MRVLVLAFLVVLLGCEPTSDPRWVRQTTVLGQPYSGQIWCIKDAGCHLAWSWAREFCSPEEINFFQEDLAINNTTVMTFSCVVR